MTSPCSQDGLLLSAASSCNCGTVTPESLSSPRFQDSSQNDSKSTSAGTGEKNLIRTEDMDSKCGCNFGKAMAQERRAFYGTDSDPSEDNCDSDAEMIGKAARSLSLDLDERLRQKVHPRAVNVSEETIEQATGNEQAAGDENFSKSVVGGEVLDFAGTQPNSDLKDHAYSPHVECEEPSAQTISCEDEVDLKDPESPGPGQTTLEISENCSEGTSSLGGIAKEPAHDVDLLKKRERQLEERVRNFIARKASSVRPSSCLGGSLAQQLKKMDVSLGGGALKVCDRNLSDEALAMIVSAVKNNDKLLELDLSGCNIHKGDYLAQFVRSAPSLKRLLLAWNNLGSARTGIAAFASAIASAPSLQEVDLRNNRIGPATAAALGLALRANNTLKCLDLMWNEICASGATALLGMLEKNHTLTELRLAGNNIPCPLQEQIDSLLERNRNAQLVTEDSNDSAESAIVKKRGSKSDCFSVQAPSDSGAQIRQIRVTKFTKTDTGDLCPTLRDPYEPVLKTELTELQKHRAELETQVEKHGERRNFRKWLDSGQIMRRERVERETEELKMEICRLKQEMASLAAKLQDNENEFCQKLTVLQTEVMDGKERERAAQEREAEADKQNQHLTDQLTVLREDSGKRIQAMEAKFKNEADYSAGLVQKLESSITQRDQKHLDEVEALRSKLTAEIDSLKSEKDNLMREVENQKCVAKLADQQLANQKQILKQEKESAEQELKRQIAMLMVEIECMQHHLEDKDLEHAKAKQRNDECMQSLENDIRKERASSTRAELAKSVAEQRLVTLEAHMEKLKAEQELTRQLEEKLQVEDLKHCSCTAALASKHSEEQEKKDGELLLSRKQIEALRVQLKELHAEHERRLKDIEMQLRTAETAVIEWVQQQFSALQTGLSFQQSVPSMDHNTVQSFWSHLDAVNVVSKAAIPEQDAAHRVCQDLHDAPPPPKVSRSSQPMAQTAYNCLPTPLSMASLVKPEYCEEVGTVDEDLVSSGESSPSYRI